MPKFRLSLVLWLGCAVLLVACGASQPTASPSSPAALVATPQVNAVSLNNQGVQKINSKDYAGAIAAFSQAIQLQPSLTEAYLGRGVAHSSLSQHEQAIADYSQAITIKPELGIAYLYRADSVLLTGKRQQAINDLKQAVKFLQQSQDQENLATAQAKLKDLQQVTQVAQGTQTTAKPQAKPSQPVAQATPTPQNDRENCDPSYPDICIPVGADDLDCPDIEYRNFRVTGSDPHGFDRDGDGIGCES